MCDVQDEPGVVKWMSLSELRDRHPLIVDDITGKPRPMSMDEQMAISDALDDLVTPGATYRVTWGKDGAVEGPVRIQIPQTYIWPNLHTPIAAIDPSLAHTVRKYKVGTETRYAVIGPDGHYRDNYYHLDHAMAEAAFWSMDDKAAAEHRKEALVRRGLVKEE